MSAPFSCYCPVITDLDRYYIWDIEESKPLILVLEDQVYNLLKEINSYLKLELTITDAHREEGLLIRFPDHPRFRPRYLGRSHSKDQYNSMVDQTPGVAVHPSGDQALPSLDITQIEDFRVLIEEAWEATKNRSKASKEKKRVQRMKKLKALTDQLKRAQRYLGLRPTYLQGMCSTWFDI